MSDEEWLRLVGEAAREEAQRDREDADRMASSPEGRKLLAPLGETARARMLAAFPEPRPARARVRTIALATSGLLAAAAMALWVGRPPRTTALPAYEVSFAGGSSAMRGAPAHASPEAATTVLHAGSSFELVFRPEEPATGDLQAAAFLVVNRQVQAWRAPIEVSPEGAVRIAGATDKLLAGLRGEVDILVFAARPGRLPPEAGALAANAAHDDAERSARIRVTIVP